MSVLTITFLLLSAGAATTEAAARIWVTDVTPRSFSLVWITSQPAVCSANIYADPQGTQSIQGIIITDESAAHPPAVDNGIMNVRISGLNPDTTYYYEIVTTSAEGEVVEPQGGDLPSVKTEVSSKPVNNDLLAHKVFQSDGIIPAQGTLVLVEVTGGSYPITGWVGYDVHLPWTLLDLNNIYSMVDHENLALTGGEEITLTSIGGSLGFRRLVGSLPIKTGGVQKLDPPPNDDECALDSTAPVIDEGQLAPAPEALINNGTPFITANYADSSSEIDTDSVALLVDGIDVTEQAAVNLNGIEYTPSTPLADSSHSVALYVADEWGYAAEPVTWSFTVDATPPTAVISYSVLTATNQNVVATLVPSETVTVTNNDGEISYTFTANGEFEFEFVDEAGNTGLATATVRNIDKIQPAVSSIFGTDGSYKVGDIINITIAFSEPVTLAGSAVLEITLDTSAIVSITAIESVAIANGFYEVHPGEASSDLTATSLVLTGGSLRDAAGNDIDLSLPAGSNLSQTSQIIIDTTDPVVAITEPANLAYLYPASQIVRWHIDETFPADVGLVFNGNHRSLDADAVEAAVNLNPGVNLIEVTVLDQAGNSATAGIQVTLDGDNDGDGIGDYNDTDDDNDGIPDNWETANGLDPFDPIDARRDSDGDGYANLTEYGAGTDPLDNENYPNITLLISHITVTDVTSQGFSVIWQTTEPGIGSLAIYDEGGVPLSNPTLVFESAMYPPAEDIGVMKVTVSGLEPDTLYYFQVVTTAKASDLVLFKPVYPEFLEVITESAEVDVTNDFIEQSIFDESGNPADGTLLVASVSDGDYPVTGWEGQAEASSLAQVDLNRIYSQTGHINLQLQGGEQLVLWSFGGQLGNYVNIQKIDQPSGNVITAYPDSANLSREAEYSLGLKIDLNVVGLPVYKTPGFTSYSLLLHLKDKAGGNSGAVEEIKRYNSESGRWETATWFAGVPTGEDFEIKPGAAFLIYMNTLQDLNVEFDGIAYGAAIDLAAGLNMVTLPAGEAGLVYNSYDMLKNLGDENAVSKVQRYDANDAARWQTTQWFLDPPNQPTPAGGAFYTQRGEGYLIYMKEPLGNWRAY